MTYKDWCDKHVKTCTAVSIPTRDGFSDDASSFGVTLNDRFHVVYSCGSYQALEWAKKLGRPIWTRTGGYATSPRDIKLTGRMTLFEREALDALLHAFRKAAPVDPTDVVECLAVDVNGADQLFEDWASDYGYDTDSRQVHKIWETCNDYRRGLIKVFGQDAYEELINVDV